MSIRILRKWSEYEHTAGLIFLIISVTMILNAKNVPKCKMKPSETQSL